MQKVNNMPLFSKINVKKINVGTTKDGKLWAKYIIEDEKQLLLATGRITRGGLDYKWSLEGKEKNELTLELDDFCSVETLQHLFEEMVS